MPLNGQQRSLSEISDLERPSERITALTGLLEYVLKQRNSDYQNLELKELLNANQELFPNLDNLHRARMVRNRIIHPNRVAPRLILEAASDLYHAIEIILPRLPEGLRRDVIGTPRVK